MTGKEITRQWIEKKAQNNEEISEVIIERELPDFGRVYFNKIHTTASWSRYFRFVREEYNWIELADRKYKTWKVKLDDQLSLKM